MKLIVGLGNPGRQYENTRHNAGFLALERIAQHPDICPVGENLSFSLNKKLKCRIAESFRKAEKVILIKPETFMNSSGLAVSKIMQFYKAEIEDLIVISDDIDLPLGEARTRHNGGSAGQKGLQNIIDELGSNMFCRIRIGINQSVLETKEIDAPQNAVDTADYVLQQFSDRELPVLEKIIDLVADNVVAHIGSKNELKATTLKV